MKPKPEEHREARHGSIPTGIGSITPRAGQDAIPETIRPRHAGAHSALADGRAQVSRPPGDRAADGAPAAEPAGAGLDAGVRSSTPVDLRAPELYLNRELTWLSFNRRVLHEAQDPRTPLLERVKFLAIVNANLDEFFMKRIGGLKQQVGAGVKDLTVDGRTPEQQIDECVAFVRGFTSELRATYLDLLDAATTSSCPRGRI
jgi:hypothetical protein